MPKYTKKEKENDICAKSKKPSSYIFFWGKNGHIVFNLKSMKSFHILKHCENAK
jgi:hypothetical protein